MKRFAFWFATLGMIANTAFIAAGLSNGMPLFGNQLMSDWISDANIYALISILASEES